MRMPWHTILILLVSLSGCHSEVDGRVVLYKTDCLTVTSGELEVDVGRGSFAITGLVATVPEEGCELITGFSFSLFIDLNNNGHEDPGENLDFLEDVGASTDEIILGSLTASWNPGAGIVRYEAKVTQDNGREVRRGGRVRNH